VVFFDFSEVFIDFWRYTICIKDHKSNYQYVDVLRL
jgi:hypothetical protein